MRASLAGSLREGMSFRPSLAPAPGLTGAENARPIRGIGAPRVHNRAVGGPATGGPARWQAHQAYWMATR